MHKKFDHRAFEEKQRARWRAAGLNQVGNDAIGKPRRMVLTEYPYPSGNLHIGHWYAFAVPDIFVRAKRMQGEHVLYPIGFDSFGLPAENAAIKNKLDPKEWTYANIDRMTTQLEQMGNSFDWSRKVITSNPDYYRWTQWIFLQFFKKGLAYRGTSVVNWCPSCNTVLANEQVANGHCERCGAEVEHREMPQWLLRITTYADRLIDDLDPLAWPEPIKDSQRNWIGRSAGAEIDFLLNFKKNPADNDRRGPDGKPAQLTVFTTRPDTLCGATYLVLAPEHPWITLAIDDEHDVLENKDEVRAYVAAAAKKEEIERTAEGKEKTGVLLAGVVAINPATGEEIPMYVADYVIGSYGTGAIMAVPAHDARDFAFARKYHLPIRDVVEPITGKTIYSAGAIIESLDGKFLLQKRTYDAPHAAGKISVFGGALDASETQEAGLVRELQEELELDLRTNMAGKRLIKFVQSDWDESKVYAIYHVWGVDASKLVLHEGESIVAVDSLDTIPDADKAGGLRTISDADLRTPYVGAGTLVNSGEFTGMDSEDAKEKIVAKVGGRMTNTYRLRDWSISRQRYWGCPIPVVYDPEGNPHAVPDEHLPWHLPEDVDFTPTGVAPLAKSEELKKRTEEIFGAGWTPEVETMDTFVDSSWYFLRYTDPANTEIFATKEAQDAWMPVDIYFGGAEHTTMHLLYSRFVQKALFDMGLATVPEPYTVRINRGLVLGPDGNKMSKSKGNVIDPDEQVTRLGADTVKMYLAFMGPYGETANYPWDMGGIAGIRRFLERVNGLSDHVQAAESAEMTKHLHRTIDKVTRDIVVFKFNTAISALMIYVNAAEKEGIASESYATFLRLIAPFAPHLADELWGIAGNTTSIHTEAWPQADPALLIEETVRIAVQVDGKVRGTIEIAPEADEAAARASGEAAVADRLEGREVVRVVYVPGRIINFITA